MAVLKVSTSADAKFGGAFVLGWKEKGGSRDEKKVPCSPLLWCFVLFL